MLGRNKHSPVYTRSNVSLQVTTAEWRHRLTSVSGEAGRDCANSYWSKLSFTYATVMYEPTDAELPSSSKETSCLVATISLYFHSWHISSGVCWLQGASVGTLMAWRWSVCLLKNKKLVTVLSLFWGCTRRREFSGKILARAAQWLEKQLRLTQTGTRESPRQHRAVEFLRQVHPEKLAEQDRQHQHRE